jgi:hypothetical protein
MYVKSYNMRGYPKSLTMRMLTLDSLAHMWMSQISNYICVWRLDWLLHKWMSQVSGYKSAKTGLSVAYVDTPGF